MLRISLLLLSLAPLSSAGTHLRGDSSRRNLVTVTKGTGDLREEEHLFYAENRNDGANGNRDETSVQMETRNSDGDSNSNNDNDNKQKATGKGTDAKQDSEETTTSNSDTGSGNSDSVQQSQTTQNIIVDEDPEDATSTPSSNTEAANTYTTTVSNNDTTTSSLNTSIVENPSQEQQQEQEQEQQQQQQQQQQQSIQSSSLFGGDQIEPQRTFTDYIVVQVGQAEQGGQSQQTTQFPSSDNEEDQGVRTMVVLFVDIGIFLFLLAIGCFPELRKKTEQAKAKTTEFSFHGGTIEYLTDADSSAASPIEAPSERYSEVFFDVDSCMYDMKTITDADACEVTSDPWSFDGNSECIDFGNVDFAKGRNPSVDTGDDDDGSSIGKRISDIIFGTINMSKRRLLDRWPQHPNASYQEFDDSSQISDPFPEGAGKEDFVPTLDEKTDEQIPQLHVSADGDIQQATIKPLRD